METYKQLKSKLLGNKKIKRAYQELEVVFALIKRDVKHNIHKTKKYV